MAKSVPVYKIEVLEYYLILQSINTFIAILNITEHEEQTSCAEGSLKPIPSTPQNIRLLRRCCTRYRFHIPFRNGVVQRASGA